jgi:hypothetical protein
LTSSPRPYLPPPSPPPAPQEKSRVGVLLVHGVGEQRKFEHLEACVREIAVAMKANPSLSVTVVVNQSEAGEVGAEKPLWQVEPTPPVVLSVKSADNQVTDLEFHEVWWADLDEPTTKRTQLEFWAWGLSLWTKPQYQSLQFGKGQEEMAVGFARGIGWFDRLRLFGFSFTVLLVLPLLSLLSTVLRNVLGSKLRPDILVQYLGDIKLYGQRKPTAPLEDLGQPARVTIRRRMIRALVSMSLAEYDRWYVLAHSLGTVVACNGLMETESALPNYLDPELWKKWQAHSAKKAATPMDPDRKMMPERPHWLAADDIVDRQTLFAHFRGVLTYGSPLSKFAVLWPAIAPLNNDETVFPANCEWINVYDPTDPIADQLKYFDPKTDTGLQPQEIAYKCQGIHLFSHTRYLKAAKGKDHLLVNQVADWLLTGNGFPTPKPSWRWPDDNAVPIYYSVRLIGWVIATLGISMVLSQFVPKGLPNWSLFNHWLDFHKPITYIFLSAVGVAITGILARWLGLNGNAPPD